MLPVGFDADGNSAYQQWGLRIGTPWEPRVSWFDIHHGHSLAVLYPGFTALLRNGDLGKAASSAIYWYLRSNRAGDGAGVDSGIILSQAALERLTSACLASLGLSQKGSPSSRFIRAWQALKLPTGIPSGTRLVRRARRKENWSNAAEALTAVRNDLVHPQGRLKAPVGRFVSEIWRLAQWYVELTLLRLSDYKGPYTDWLRARWVGEVENVPWATRRNRS